MSSALVKVSMVTTDSFDCQHYTHWSPEAAQVRAVAVSKALLGSVAGPATNAFEANVPSGAVLLWELGVAPRRVEPALDTGGAPDSHGVMRSQLADAARQSLNEDVKRMTAEERLAAYLAHCQLIAQLSVADALVQRQPRDAAPRNAPKRAGPVGAADGRRRRIACGESRSIGSHRRHGGSGARCRARPRRRRAC